MINGSFAALFDTNAILDDYARDLELGSRDYNGAPIRLAPRRRLQTGKKQYRFTPKPNSNHNLTIP